MKRNLRVLTGKEVRDYGSQMEVLTSMQKTSIVDQVLNLEGEYERQISSSWQTDDEFPP